MMECDERGDKAFLCDPLSVNFLLFGNYLRLQGTFVKDG